MTRERPSLGFADALDAADLTQFAPKPKGDRPPQAQVAAAASAAGFASREARVPVPEEPAAQRAAGQGDSARVPKQQRRRRTGRSAQINLKAKPETIEAYCAIADRMGWGLGETLEKAVELLHQQYGSPT